jgi:stearoyl-CoA desaturase (delta-9 desaturase)
MSSNAGMHQGSVNESNDRMPHPLREDEERSRWHWSNITLIVVVHGLAAPALLPAFFHWSGPALMALLFYLSGGLGVCLGYHRLLTHRSLHTPKIVEYALTVLGTLSFQGSPREWVGTHRIHHKESDGPHDPHSPQHGFTWAHILWCFYRHPAGYDPLHFTRDLQCDRTMMLIDGYHWLPQVLLGALLFGLGWAVLGSWQGGMCWLVWGVGVRTTLMYHATWFVNSAAHTWGYRNFDTRDGSRNNWWVATLSFGEGWHNNHHAQPRSAAHGMRRWELDPTYWVICLMERIGLATRVVRPKPPELARPTGGDQAIGAAASARSARSAR